MRPKLLNVLYFLFLWIQNTKRKKSDKFIPTTVSLNIWLILGFVETWHSKFPASVALVNFSFKVFCPRLKKSVPRLLLKNLSNRHPPSWDQLESLIIDVFFFSNKKRISIKSPHPWNLPFKAVNLLTKGIIAMSMTFFLSLFLYLATSSSQVNSAFIRTFIVIYWIQYTYIVVLCDLKSKEYCLYKISS